MKTIKNIHNLGLGELLCELYNSEDIDYLSNLDFRNHIKKITNNFDEEFMFHLYLDLKNFFSDEVNIIFDENEKYSLGEVYRCNPKSDKYKYPTEDEYNSTNETDMMYLMATNLIEYNEQLKFENKIGFEQVMDYILEFNNIADEMELEFSVRIENGLYGDFMRIGKDKKNFNSFKIDRFEDLFKKEYRNNEIQNNFIKWLKNKHFINQENNLNVNHAYFARLYYLLREWGIMIQNLSHSMAMRTYFSKFGVKVVENIDPEDELPQVTRRSVTSEDTRITDLLDLSKKDEQELYSIFKNKNK